MNRNTFPNPEHRQPHLVLREGIDYIDRQELHSRILEKLEEMGIGPDRVLLCGYDGSIVSDTPRTSIAAMTPEETAENIADGFVDTPYEYAEDAFRTGGRPVVAAYDRLCFIEREASAYGYDLNPHM